MTTDAKGETKTDQGGISDEAYVMWTKTSEEDGLSCCLELICVFKLQIPSPSVWTVTFCNVIKQS